MSGGVWVPAAGADKKFLTGRMVRGKSRRLIVAAWVASAKDAARIGHHGAVLVWPEMTWIWTDDLLVSGHQAAVVPAFNRRETREIRKTLAVLLLPYGNDKWVAEQAGYQHLVSSFFIRQQVGDRSHHYLKLHEMGPRERIWIVLDILDGRTKAEVASLNRTAQATVVEVLYRFKRVSIKKAAAPRNRAAILGAVLREYGFEVFDRHARDWKLARGKYSTNEAQVDTP